MRGRAIDRVQPDKHWSVDLVQSIAGTPANPLSADDSVVESFPNPHTNAGDAERDALDGEPGPGDNIAAHRRTKIKKSDLSSWTQRSLSQMPCILQQQLETLCH